MSVKKTWLCAVSLLLLVTGLPNAGNGQSRPASEDVADCASSVPVPLPALPTCAGTIPRYAACEIELTSARPEGYYHNPFTNVAVQAQFTNGSQTVTASGFYDGGRTWRIRFAPQTEEGTLWTYTVSNSAADTGLQVLPSVPTPSRSFAVGAAAGPGFIEIDPAHPYYFQFSTGTPFFGIGDTSYGMVSGISDAQRQAYLNDRKAKQFNFIRFFATGSPLAINRSLTTAEAWPWGGTPEAPQYTRLNPQFFRRLDRVIAELKACDMYAEVIVFNYYPTSPMPTAAFATLHQELWARYVVSRLSASDRVFLWTVTNEYDIYPRGRYEAFTPEDNEWAEAMAAQFHQFDPHRHPTTVHPWESPQMAAPPADIGPRFAGSPAIDVLSQQHWGKYRWDADKDCNDEVEEAASDHMDAALRRDRRYLMPVINTENHYEWLSDYPHPANFFACTDKARRSAWRIFLGGAATYANGFAGTWAGRDPYDFKDIVGARFTLRVEGMGRQVGYYATFISHTDFRSMNPAQHLVTATTLCLAKPGSEYVVYAPDGGGVPLNLEGQTGSFAVTLLDPRTGGTTTLPPIAGGAWRDLVAPAGNDYVFHVKRQESTPPDPSALTNLVLDPSFEQSPAFVSWGVSPNSPRLTSTLSTGSAPHGTAAAQVNVNTAGQAADAELRQVLPLSPRGVYRLRFWAKASSPRPLTTLLTQDNTPWGLVGLWQRVSLSSQWQQFDTVFTYTGGEAEARLVFRMGDYRGTVWIDNVELRAQP